MSFGLVLTCTWSGQLGEAIEHSDATLGLGRLSGSAQVLSWAHGLRALIELRSGALASALDHGEQAQQLGEGMADNPFSAVNGGWFGEALIEAGQPVRGRDQILGALGGPDLPAIESPYRPYFYDVLAGAEATLGRGEHAARWAARRARPPRARTARAHRRRTARGRRGRARPRGGREARAPGGDGARARSPDRGGPGANPGRPPAWGRRTLGVGVRELQRATEELTALGAAHYAAQAIRERRRLGEHLARGGRRTSATTGIGSLSDREREVAGLVQDRLTNREIAERLALSEKTIERHLSRIFVKLEARSRVEVARMLESSEPTA